MLESPMIKKKNKPSKTPPVMSPQSAEIDEFSPPDEERSGDGMDARRACLQLLDDVLQRKQALDHALEHQEAFTSLPQRDRAFTRMMISTILRRLGQIDDLIEKAIEKKDTPRNFTLQNILRLGAVQILFMGVADHAAVDTSVRLAEEKGMERQKPFVNGLLRTLTRTGEEWKARQDEGRLNTPEWLLKIWIEDYSLKTAAEIARANLSEAPLDIAVRDPGAKISWASIFKATELTTGSLRITAGGPITDLPGFDEGQWWVQDASAAIPMRLMGDVEGQSVIDLCAAPGGKTLQLAAAGAHVIALDRSAPRLRRLEDNLKRMQLAQSVEVICADASTWKPKQPAPYILLDAPCSATGTIRRHPDVPHLKSPRDLPGLINIQAAILENAFEILMVGGVLIYCTCSLQKAEGEAQIEAFLSRNPAASRLPIAKEELGGWDEALTPEGDLRILPFHMAALGGMDGFFIARLTKVA
jgi:16S rRNA (cytosine967-C5)-methyltransferase